MNSDGIRMILRCTVRNGTKRGYTSWKTEIALFIW